MEGFISRQRRTKAISPDTNIDEYVYRSPQTGKLKQGWGRRASRTLVDGFSQPGGRAHQICHHDTLLRNCSLYTHPRGGGGGRTTFTRLPLTLTNHAEKPEGLLWIYSAACLTRRGPGPS